MQDLTTPSISALESITPDRLFHVSGGCGSKCPPRRPPPPPEPPAPPEPPLPTVMAQGPQERRGGPQIINSVTITTPGGTTQRLA
jgi:hypothetical protein